MVRWLANSTMMTLAAFALGGCYSSSSFRSETAAIYDADDPWSWPQYTIICDPLIASSNITVEHELTSPPTTDEMFVGLVFLSKEDFEQLCDSGTTVRMSIRNRSGHIVFEGGGLLRQSHWTDPLWDRDWGEGWSIGVRLPPDWVSRPEARQIECGVVRLRSTTYTLRVEVEMQSEIESPVAIYPSIVGGGTAM